MGNDLSAYIEWVEIMAFFSGYPLLYAIIHVLGESNKTIAAIKRKFVFLLPFSYALTGTLYLGLQLKSLYPDFSIENIKLTLQDSYLKIWAFSSLLFWIPVFSKKPVFSLLHSLVFFFFLVKDLFLHFSQSTDKSVIRNDMNMYTISLLITMTSLAFTLLIHFLITRIKRQKSL